MEDIFFTRLKKLKYKKEVRCASCGGPGGEQGWSAPKPDPGRMIHWSDNQMIGQMSFINDIQYSTGPCAQQAGLALAHDSGVVTHRGGIQAENTEGWLITPPHVCSLIPIGLLAS